MDVFLGRELGLATVLSVLGLSATYAGKVMGSTSTFGGELGSTVLPLAASAFAVTMGLNVLELVKLDLPSFEGGLEYMTSLPKNARAYLLGESRFSEDGGRRLVLIVSEWGRREHRSDGLSFCLRG